MTAAEHIPSRDEAKRVAVFDTAATVFSQYGFRRTTMNDIAEAAGISRPALYLMFENKEHLFVELASFRLDQAIEAAVLALSGSGSLEKRFGRAILDFERIFYEPIADSPHGAELMETNVSLKTDRMMSGLDRLFGMLADTLKQAEESGEVSFASSPTNAAEFVSLLFTAIGGIKKKASTAAEFRKQVQQITQIFLQTISK